MNPNKDNFMQKIYMMDQSGCLSASLAPFFDTGA